jgi:hypothetical protein
MSLSDPAKNALQYAMGGVPGAAAELVTAMGLVADPTAGTAAVSKAVVLDSTGSVTWVDGGNVTFGATTGTKLGTTTSGKLAFHGSTAVVQRSGASQASVTTTTATSSGGVWGFSTSAQANAIITLVNEIRAALVEKGLIAGA